MTRLSWLFTFILLILCGMQVATAQTQQSMTVSTGQGSMPGIVAVSQSTGTDLPPKKRAPV